MNFQEWFNEKPVGQPVKKKLWRANKEQIMSYWKNLRSDTPLSLNPIPYGHTGSTYGKDGIRLTGSQHFISSVLPRLKEFLQFENPNTKLQIVYRQTENPKNPAETSFAFYLQSKERGPNQKERLNNPKT